MFYKKKYLELEKRYKSLQATVEKEQYSRLYATEEKMREEVDMHKHELEHKYRSDNLALQGRVDMLQRELTFANDRIEQLKYSGGKNENS